MYDESLHLACQHPPEQGAQLNCMCSTFLIPGSTKQDVKKLVKMIAYLPLLFSRRGRSGTMRSTVHERGWFLAE